MQTWVKLVENFFNIISPVLCSLKKQKKKQQQQQQIKNLLELS